MTTRRLLLAAPLLAAPAFIRAQGQSQPDKVVFATNWRAQAAHGGFYQALVDGSYARAGLAVEIRQGGPQVNNRPLLPAKKIDFLMTGNLLHGFDNAKLGIPTRSVAAIFAKDPQALIAHPGQGFESFEALKKAPRIWIAKDAQFSWWQWLKRRHGFRDEALRPYNYTLGPFLAHKQSVQQAYSVAEPIYVKQQGGFEPVVHLLADHGWRTPSTLIDTHADTLRERPELVRRFVQASVEGWRRYLSGSVAERAAADARMRQDNPEMSQAELEASHALMVKQQLAGAPLGQIRLAQVEGFLQDMVTAGLHKPGEVDVRQVAVESFS
ncbi:NitT/TauT family transport system substrate-binding protein [Inhella inkyongensis]|uniref:NitT/TauT family transport system substrate-binding protein n=1 Tax=Inhella inkyongensis TaxID=392593 RepID=A0A840S6D4_9BURK|nr:ABC transporter substrate-binding protein [Inhella inkyongensis]MBB5205152.1 NitT/TauT family transport system substrate-binding protein [Inhella inkyongensis]